MTQYPQTNIKLKYENITIVDLLKTRIQVRSAVKRSLNRVYYNRKKIIIKQYLYIYYLFVRVVYSFSYEREAYITLLLYIFISGVFRIK